MQLMCPCTHSTSTAVKPEMLRRSRWLCASLVWCGGRKIIAAPTSRGLALSLASLPGVAHKHEHERACSTSSWVLSRSLSGVSTKPLHWLSNTRRVCVRNCVGAATKPLHWLSNLIKLRLTANLVQLPSRYTGCPTGIRQWVDFLVLQPCSAFFFRPFSPIFHAVSPFFLQLPCVLRHGTRQSYPLQRRWLSARRLPHRFASC